MKNAVFISGIKWKIPIRAKLETSLRSFWNFSFSLVGKRITYIDDMEKAKGTLKDTIYAFQGRPSNTNTQRRVSDKVHFASNVHSFRTLNYAEWHQQLFAIQPQRNCTTFLNGIKWQPN